MKFFDKKRAFSLAELIVSIFIISFIIFTVITFVNSSSQVLVNSNKKTDISMSVLGFKNSIDKIINKGYSDFIIINSSLSYNSVLFFNKKFNKAFLLGVVDLDTKRLKTVKTFGKNYIGYRLISEAELLEIKFDKNKIYDKVFQKDKLLNVVVKDFMPKSFTGDFLSKPVLDLDLSLITYTDKSAFGKKFDELNISYKDYVYDYNLAF